MSWLLNSAPATTARWSTGTPWSSWRLPTSSAEPEAPIAEFRSRHQGAFVGAVRHHDQIMDQLFFDQYDTQVGVIGVLAGPVGLRATAWRRPGGRTGRDTGRRHPVARKPTGPARTRGAHRWSRMRRCSRPSASWGSTSLDSDGASS